MTLPLSARERLVAPLRAPFSTVELRAAHSLPIPSGAWATRIAALTNSIMELATFAPSLSAGFDACRHGVEHVTREATGVASQLLALQPFAPFDHGSAERLLTLLDRRLNGVAERLLAGDEVEVDAVLRREAEGWPATGGCAGVRAALCEAFAMPDPPIDEAGEFRAEWVLAHYAYRANDLLPRLLPHLASLGVPGLTDVLAAVTVVGEIVSRVDPATAYVQMDALIGRFLAADHETGSAVRSHLTLMEPAMRRATNAAARASQVVREAGDSDETRANALADSYKRLVEGSFRQFSWAMFCLGEGTWNAPPTLGVLRDRLVAAGGWLGQVTSRVVIPELRNGEAHETLVWDGFAEHFVTEGVQISAQQVVDSAELAQCIVAGCEAGLAAIRFLDLSGPVPPLPEHDEPGRMPTWRRVQAFFGTNRLRLLDASLNTRHASLSVERLGLTDVNPCIQALVLSRRLLPSVETFSVRDSGGEVMISVSADALAATMPAWEFAVSNLDQIPLATFLPANLDARMRIEQHNIAIRSAAWIAVDDAVGIIDGSPEVWDEEDRSLIDTRLHVVELAVRTTRQHLGTPSPRLDSVAGSVAALRTWITQQRPNRARLAEHRSEFARLRMQWENWGPVPRHPLVSEDDTRDPNERQPRLRKAPEDLAFRTL